MTSVGEGALVRNLYYLSQAQDTTSHNLANVTSDGFKRRFVVPAVTGQQFDDFLGAWFPVTAMQQHIDWRSGSFARTSDPTKFAMRDDNLFVRVRTTDGQIAYTRTGDLSLDPSNRLTTKLGHFVLDDIDEPIVVVPKEGERSVALSELRISPNGELELEKATIARMGLYEIQDLDKLVPIGSGTYMYTGSNNLALAQSNAVTQSFVEQSNTESVNEMIQLINNQRGFQSTMSALRTLGRIKESYVNAFNR